LSRQEFAVLGAAIVAGYAVGVFTDLKATASGFVHPTSRVEPRPEYHEFYKPLADLYATLISDVKPHFQRLSEIPSPPGGE
jgi:xylulokinase